MKALVAHVFAGVVTVLTSGNQANAARWTDDARAQVMAHCVLSKADSEDPTEQVDRVAVACKCVTDRVAKSMSVREFESMGADESRPTTKAFFTINEECEAAAGL
jgi:hypothetical protein